VEIPDFRQRIYDFLWVLGHHWESAQMAQIVFVPFCVFCGYSLNQLGAAE
jgi:hypothetical protein